MFRCRRGAYLKKWSCTPFSTGPRRKSGWYGASTWTSLPSAATLAAIDSTKGAVTSPSYLGYEEVTMQIFIGLLYTIAHARWSRRHVCTQGVVIPGEVCSKHTLSACPTGPTYY